jgi:hypothetical protein
MRIFLICALMFISGCATHVQLQYGKLTLRMEEPTKNYPKTIEELFDKEKKPLVDKRLTDTLEWITNPSRVPNNVEHRPETQ